MSRLGRGSWRAIGNPETISPALNMPGGALAAVRNAGGTTDLQSVDLVQVEATASLVTPEHASPAPDPG